MRCSERSDVKPGRRLRIPSIHIYLSNNTAPRKKDRSGGTEAYIQGRVAYCPGNRFYLVTRDRVARPGFYWFRPPKSRNEKRGLESVDNIGKSLI